MQHYFDKIDTVLEKQMTSRNGLDISQVSERLNEFIP